ncbi:MAG: hypothetical protein NC222_07065, partial [Staphylococcus sp.]|nr:hypothetical protein [Staphylococcus sp.]
MVKNVITLIKGDDTNWNDEQSFVINLDTELDLTEGFSAEFTLGDITKKFPVIEENKIEPVLTHKETSKLDIGYLNGTLKIFDYQMRIKTIKSNIPFVIKEGVYTSNKDINANPEQLPTEEINLSIGSANGTTDYNK